ncbi:unnamed protein product [Moneuplotes crassus]|uniref:Uncharacterized protein n=1 Tax=Euplotes crassus TaxID=5936 RepID=A0AAD1XFM2_EUPCR|nr:unnamed protein product [Moneuplotes crassus]
MEFLNNPRIDVHNNIIHLLNIYYFAKSIKTKSHYFPWKKRLQKFFHKEQVRIYFIDSETINVLKNLTFDVLHEFNTLFRFSI